MAMTTARPRIIDGDGHIFEDVDAIAAFLPPVYDDLPNIRRRGIFPPLDHMHAQPSKNPPGAFRNPGPEGWAAFLDDTGIDAAVLYPTAGLAYGRMIDVDWAIAVTRAYNDWLYEAYLRHNPRLKGVGLIPLQDPAAAKAELRRIVDELGMCGAMLPATGLPVHLGSPAYWPVYEEANRLGCCLAVHGGGHGNLGLNDLNVFAAIHAMGHPFGIMISFAAMLFNGFFDRFPNVRVGYLEGGAAWFMMAMERFTSSLKDFGPFDIGERLVKLRPGQTMAGYIVERIEEGRIYVGVEGDEPTLPYAVQMAGADAFMYSSDFPHEVSVDGCKEEIAEFLASDALPADAKNAILHRNAARFYGLG